MAIARSDYVGCVGAVSVIHKEVDATYDNHENYHKWPGPKHFDGMIYMRSEVSFRQVTDGTSKTYMVGEKSMNIDAYEGGTATDHGDDEGYLTGHNGDNVRSSAFPAIPDAAGSNPYENWGSAHPEVFNMMFADGSARPLTYDIDPVTHRGLGTRAGSEVTSDY